MVDMPVADAATLAALEEDIKLFGGGWNHRVIHFKNEGIDEYSIHEVYYDKDGNPNGYTDPTAPFGESVDELARDVCYIAGALAKPVLTLIDGKLVEEARE